MMYDTLIEPEQLRLLLNDTNVAVVDCRFALKDTAYGLSAYDAGHIPLAVYAHLDEDLSSPIIKGETGRHPLPEINTLAKLLGTWGITEGVQVVAYDDAGGVFAARLWWLLRWLGHESVAVLNGGWSAWCEAGGEVSQQKHIATSCETFQPRLQSNMVVHVAEVQARLGDPTFYMVDSRILRRYRGEFEPIDPIAGRIPGARHASHEEVVGSEGKFLDATALREHFEKVLGDCEVGEAVFYCGSGISAAKNLLALVHSGLGLARLYAGSWSEWITDSSRQIEHDRES